MENIILQLQTLLDEIDYEGLDFTGTKEKLKEIIDDANNSFDNDYIEDEINY